MKFDLKTPCRNCPFRNDETRITFACRERAEEIEEIAYRQGFVCHLSAEEHELADGESVFEFGPDSQHCAGALLMFLHDTGGSGNVPFERLDEDEQDRIQQRLDWSAPVFETSEEFIDANDFTRGSQDDETDA